MKPNGPQVEAVTVALCAMARYLPHQNGSSISSDGTFANTVTQVIAPTCVLGNSSGSVTFVYFTLVLTGQVRLFFNNLSLNHIYQRDMERWYNYVRVIYKLIRIGAARPLVFWKPLVSTYARTQSEAYALFFFTYWLWNLWALARTLVRSKRWISACYWLCPKFLVTCKSFFISARAKASFHAAAKKTFTKICPALNRFLLLSSGVSAPISTLILCDNPEKSPNLAMYHVPPEFKSVV